MNDFWKNVILQILIATSSAIIAAGVLGLFSLPQKMDSIETSLKALEERIDNLQSNFDNLQSRVFALEQNNSSIIINNNNNYNPDATILSPEYGAFKPLEDVASTNGIMYALSAPTWNNTDIIGTDRINGTVYKAEDLVKSKILIPYMDNGKEVYFYGQYNENNNWSENCIINMYENNVLTLIMEGYYEDGKLINYKQIIPFTTNNGTDVWIVSERKNEGDYNSGESYNYFRNNSYIKDFGLNDVSTENIFDVESFKAGIDDKIEAYYYGNTSNGYYNDNTGDAYLVKYASDGTTVRMLYEGKFVNGEMDDNTGNAWYIILGYDNTNYHYYTGRFKNGNRIDEHSDKDFPIVTTEEINNIIKGKKYNCELNWLDQTNT